MMQFIDLKAQYNTIENKIERRIKGVLEHGHYIMGPEVYELEEKLADYVGVKHCVTCANGTDALQLSLMALGIGPGDAVFTTPFTFFATAEAIAIVGATPVFVDVDENTYNICPSELERVVSSFEGGNELTPKAIIAVDLFGLPADYSKIESVAEKYGLKLIEDGAQGFGGELSGRKACSFGDIATTSFFPAKPLGCYGDGGALFTNSDELAEVLKSLRVHGKGTDKYNNVRIGMNSRLDTIQAAVLLEKLEIFPFEVNRRNEIASIYNKSFEGSFKTPFVPSGALSSWAQYTLRPNGIGGREYYQDLLRKNSIPTAVYYAKSLHKQVAFEQALTEALITSERLESEVFSLPMHPYLSEKDQESVIRALLG